MSISVGDQHGLRAQAATDLEPVEARQHHVEHDQVVVGGGRAHHGLIAGDGDVDSHALAPKTFAQQRRELRFVLYDKDTHPISFARVARNDCFSDRVVSRTAVGS